MNTDLKNFLVSERHVDWTIVQSENISLIPCDSRGIQFSIKVGKYIIGTISVFAKYVVCEEIPEAAELIIKKKLANKQEDLYSMDAGRRKKEIEKILNE